MRDSPANGMAPPPSGWLVVGASSKRLFVQPLPSHPSMNECDGLQQHWLITQFGNVTRKQTKAKVGPVPLY